MKAAGPAAAPAAAQDKERVVAEFLPYIRYAARRLAWRLPPSLSEEDLVSAGVTGLLEALNRFEGGRARLRTFAEYRIRGAMLDALRAADTVPRSARERIRAARAAHARLERLLGRLPEDAEVAREMGLSLADYRKVLAEIGRGVLVRLDDFDPPDAPGEGGLENLPDRAGLEPCALLEAKRCREAVARLIRELPERERLVLSLYYWDEMTMKEIGAVLGLSEGRVCQIHCQALLRVRARLEPQGA